MISVSKRAHRPRVRFDPAGFKRARRQHQNGDSKELIEMMKEAAIDSHVSGCLMGRRSGFKKSYALTPYDDTEPSKERLEFFRGVLQRLRLRDLLEDIHDGRLYLYHVIDFEWELKDGRQVPTGFKSFEQHHFRRNDDGELGIDRGNRVEEIPETALVVESRKRPIMLPVLRDYILKEFGLESWASFLETFGEPFILAKYPPGADDKFKEQVDRGLEAMASSSRGRVPKGTDWEVKETGRSTGDHSDFTDRADTGISVTLLGHANAVEDSGGVNVGGRQQSFEVRHSVAVDDMHFIEPHVNRLIRIIGQQNFGDGRYPRFELKKAKPVNAKEHAEIVDVAWRHGARIHRSEYEKLGLKIDPEQEWLQKSGGSIPLTD